MNSQISQNLKKSDKRRPNSLICDTKITNIAKYQGNRRLSIGNSHKNTQILSMDFQQNNKKKNRLLSPAIDISTESSEMTSEYTKSTELLENKIMQTLNQFKLANTNYIHENLSFKEGVSKLKNDLTQLKSEVSDTILEKNKSIEGISKLRSLLSSPSRKSSVGEVVSRNSLTERKNIELNDKIQSLQDEIKEMKRRYELTEKHLQKKDDETRELKQNVRKLQFDDRLLKLESKEKTVACTNCLIF